MCQLYMYQDEASGPSIRLDALAVVRPQRAAMPLQSPSPPDSPMMGTGSDSEGVESRHHTRQHPHEQQQQEVAVVVKEEVAVVVEEEDSPASSLPRVSSLGDATGYACAAENELSPFLPAVQQLQRRCNLLVATAILRGVHLLQQPTYCHGSAVDEYRRAQHQHTPAGVCHVAFVDWASERVLKQKLKALLFREGEATFIGCWQLLRLGAGLPFVAPAANVVSLELLLPLLFPTSNTSLWVEPEAKLSLSKEVLCCSTVRQPASQPSQLVAQPAGRPASPPAPLLLPS